MACGRLADARNRLVEVLARELRCAPRPLDVGLDRGDVDACGGDLVLDRTRGKVGERGPCCVEALAGLGNLEPPRGRSAGVRRSRRRRPRARGAAPRPPAATARNSVLPRAAAARRWPPACRCARACGRDCPAARRPAGSNTVAESRAPTPRCRAPPPRAAPRQPSRARRTRGSAPRTPARSRAAPRPTPPPRRHPRPQARARCGRSRRASPRAAAWRARAPALASRRRAPWPAPSRPWSTATRVPGSGSAPAPARQRPARSRRERRLVRCEPMPEAWRARSSRSHSDGSAEASRAAVSRPNSVGRWHGARSKTCSMPSRRATTRLP